MRQRLFISIPAYNAAKTLPSVFRRMPAEIAARVEQYIIVNDGSKDDTGAVARELMRGDPKIRLIEHPKNRGYGGACKTGLAACRDAEADLVAWVHADGQYAPEVLPMLLAPLEDGSADMVQGSRMLGGGALRGGMPFYKYVANKLLSLTENLVFNMRLAEFHSGYMLYHRRALERIPFQAFADNFIFDQEMMIVCNDLGMRLAQLAIPTRYADEESHLKVIPYGFAVLGMMGSWLTGGYGVDHLRAIERGLPTAGERLPILSPA